MLQILEMKLREIRHNIFGYMSYAPSYSSATPSFVKEKVPAPHLPITSPPSLSSLRSRLQPDLPLPTQEKNTLPSFLLKENTILPHLFACPLFKYSCDNNMATKDHLTWISPPPLFLEGTCPPCPFDGSHPAPISLYAFPKQCDNRI